MPKSSSASRPGKAPLHKEAVKQTNALRAMASLGPVPRGVLFVVLDQHRRIVASPNPGVLTESRISPGDNFAKIRVDRKNRPRPCELRVHVQNTASSATSTMAVASRISTSDCSA